ncbi:plectin-like isoform X2 [Tachypleus tridentatus]|uniref:plectin-like isoform X2 n=2 Tax=Tachypleus tridentatus TaxID=6853 RepID=UPI003FCF1AAF
MLHLCLQPRERGRMRFHMLQNVQIALDFLKYRKIKLVNIRADDIVDANPKLTLGLIWTIILHFQISDIIGQTDKVLTAREALLLWAQRTTDQYPGVKVTDLTKSWKDGLAFNAIIHRNRPDLIDWTTLRAKPPRDNLELAFSILEKECGVTRLLDPEDVDTPDPDERSLITYISSLYDVFSEPPDYHPLADSEKLRKVEDYKELASTLKLWIQGMITVLQDHTFPCTLVEMKALLVENNKLRVAHIPLKLHEKQKLFHLYTLLQKTFRETGSVDIETELQFDTIEENWNQLMLALQSRDQAIRDEISRQEKLQRLAEKIHREAKQCDRRIDDIEKKVIEEEVRSHRLHPVNAVENCDQIEAELTSIDENIQTMFKEVESLQDGSYHQTHEVCKRVQNLHQRWTTVHTTFTTKLLNPLSTRTVKSEERQVTKQRQVVYEQYLVDTNEAFKFLQECLDWVNGKLKFLHSAEYGSDLPSVKSILEQHQTEHQAISQFHRNIDQCGTKKNQFRGDEQDFYCRLLTKLEKSYSELVNLSNRRLTDLEILLDFIQSATNEMMWMNRKEEVEVTRDWNSVTLNIVEIEQYQETFSSELEKREIQFNAITDRGQSLKLQKHPASDCIEAYLRAMQSQWHWLLQLTICLDEHLRNVSVYHQFFTEAKESEQWLARIEEQLTTTFSRKTFPINEGESLLKQMLDIKEDMTHYKDIVVSLVNRSKEIVPLKQRQQPLQEPLKVTAICSYKQLNMTLTRNEQCWLHDNSQRIKWKVINSAGTEGLVPGVCFVIPPPNFEAIDLAQSLNKKYDNVWILWSKKYHKLRQNLIFSTVRVIRSWDFVTFCNMEPAQRDSIHKALNEDGQKLLQEGDSNDPDLKQLQEEIIYCNKLFQDFLNSMKSDEVDKTAHKKFSDLVTTLQNSLKKSEKTLEDNVQTLVPWDQDTLEGRVLEHKEFETNLKSLEPQVEDMKLQFQSMTKTSSALQHRHDTVISMWERIWAISHLYIERLKALEILMNNLVEATTLVTQVEVQLANCDPLSAERTTLIKTHELLMTIQEKIQQGQTVIDQINSDLVIVWHLTERTRPKQVKHSDVNKIEEDVKKVTKRWDSAGLQVVERLRSCEAATELLQTYRTKMENNEEPWLMEMSIQVKNLKPINLLTPPEIEKQVQNAMDIYNTIAQRKSAIEETNTLGGRYVREAKIYDLRLKHYRESLEEVHPSLDASIPKKAKVVIGADDLSQELDILNQNYTELVNTVLEYLNKLRDLLLGQKDYKISMTISRAVPITPHSFRSEINIVQDSHQEPVDVGRRYSYKEDHEKPTQIEQTETKHILTTTTKIPEDTIEKPKKRYLDTTAVTIKKIKPTKMLEETDDERSRDYITTVKGIVNPKTRELLTMAEAIRLGILNIESAQYTDVRSGKLMNLPDAVSKGLIDDDFVNRVTESCGIIDLKTGVELTLIEAIQKGLFDPDKGHFLDPKNGRPITFAEAVRMGVITEDGVRTLIERKIYKIFRLTIVEAIKKGLLNPHTGQFLDPKTNQCMTLKEAFEKEFLVHMPVWSEGGLPLTDAIDRGMVNDEGGQIVDEDSGEKFNIEQAVLRSVIRNNVSEVVNTESGEILCVPEALSQNVINVQMGRFFSKKLKKGLLSSKPTRIIIS